jgi:DNA-binding transcriptional MerR regulator
MTQSTNEEIDFLTSPAFIEEFPNLMNKIQEPRFSINDLNIAPRDATYWDKQGALPKIKGVGLRRKYDLLQSVWIKLIQQMRSLGISHETIKNLKEKILEPKLNLNQIDPEIVNKLLNELQMKYGSIVTEQELITSFKETLPSAFEAAVVSTIVFRKGHNCLVNKDGDYLLYCTSDHLTLIENNKDFFDFISKPYFSISFANAYQSLVKEWSPKSFFLEASLLSETELEILNSIRRDDINSLKIRYKEGEPDLLEIEEQKQISIEQRFLDVIAKNSFQKITISTRNGKIVNYVNKIQHKLKKSTK